MIAQSTQIPLSFSPEQLKLDSHAHPNACQLVEALGNRPTEALFGKLKHVQTSEGGERAGNRAAQPDVAMHVEIPVKSAVGRRNGRQTRNTSR